MWIHLKTTCVATLIVHLISGKYALKPCHLTIISSPVVEYFVCILFFSVSPQDTFLLEKLSEVSIVASECLCLHVQYDYQFFIHFHFKHPYLANDELCALRYLVLSDLNCVAIEGCSGSGKTTLLKNLMKICQRKVGEDVVFLHLGDQIDSKVIHFH